MLKKLLLITASSMVLFALAGCEDKGTAQKAGESVDKTATAISDAVTPAGPAEKIGRKIDAATDTNSK
jgi:predicted small secreted protein